MFNSYVSLPEGNPYEWETVFNQFHEIGETRATDVGVPGFCFNNSSCMAYAPCMEYLPTFTP